MKIEIHVAASTGYDASLDNIAKQVEDLMASDRTLGGNASGIIYTGTDLTFEGGGDDGTQLVFKDIGRLVPEEGRLSVVLLPAATDRVVTSLVWVALLVALLPLASLLWKVVDKGAGSINLKFLTWSMRNVIGEPGGIYHAIIGTVLITGAAAVISVPIGLLSAIYLVEYGGTSKMASWIRFLVDVMTGIPSIVAGLFVLSFWILGLGQGFSGFAAALALSVLMLPIIVRSSEEMLKLVPDSLREASPALGVPRWKTILRIVLPTALPGIVTGVMLAVARVAGETAPVLLTAFGADSINNDPFHGAQSSLPLYVFQQAGNPQTTAVNRAWTAALALILVVMVLNLLYGGLVVIGGTVLGVAGGAVPVA